MRSWSPPSPRTVRGRPCLNEHIHRGYAAQLKSWQEHPAVRTIVADDHIYAEAPTPTLLATTVPELLSFRDDLLVECFGPTSMLVEYADDDELLAAATVGVWRTVGGGSATARKATAFFRRCSRSWLIGPVGFSGTAGPPASR